MLTDDERDKEARALAAHLRAVEVAPLHVQKDRAKSFSNELEKDPNYVVCLVSSLFTHRAGTLQAAAEREVRRPNSKRRAHHPGRGRSDVDAAARLIVLVAVLDYQCPRAMATAAWKRLPAAERQRLRKAVRMIIKRMIIKQDMKTGDWVRCGACTGKVRISR